MSLFSVVFVDMDGVLCDFAAGAVRTFRGRLDEEVYPPSRFDLETSLGLSAGEFRKTIDDAGPAWWSELSGFPWTDALIDLVRRYGRSWFVLSSDSPFAFAAEGKSAWLRRLRSQPDGKIFTRRKSLFAAPGRLLIDDADENVEEFRRSGGEAVLFPQPWNRNAPFVEDRMGRVVDELFESLSARSPEERGRK
jgi:5'(3')-deoxyribonucleotidase